MRKKIIVTLFCVVCVSMFVFLPSSYGQGKVNGSLYVLCYHTFLGKDKIPTDVSLNELKKQMEYFKNSGFTFVSFQDVLADRVSGSKNILITIDDGNRSLIEADKRVFKPMGIKPLLGIYPNIIGKKEYAMNWEELKSLSNEGYDIASHGYYHLHLNDKLYKKDKTSFENEILKSKKILEEKLGKNVEAYIYANGVRSQIAKLMLEKSGYKCAFAITWGKVLLPLGSNPDPMELHRYMVSGNFNQISSIIENQLKAEAK